MDPPHDEEDGDEEEVDDDEVEEVPEIDVAVDVEGDHTAVAPPVELGSFDRTGETPLPDLAALESTLDTPDPPPIALDELAAPPPAIEPATATSKHGHAPKEHAPAPSPSPAGVPVPPPVAPMHAPAVVPVEHQPPPRRPPEHAPPPQRSPEPARRIDPPAFPAGTPRLDGAARDGALARLRDRAKKLTELASFFPEDERSSAVDAMSPEPPPSELRIDPGLTPVLGSFVTDRNK
jgi:hypothetical protein